jgi:hypothetical protein
VFFFYSAVAHHSKLQMIRLNSKEINREKWKEHI